MPSCTLNDITQRCRRTESPADADRVHCTYNKETRYCRKRVSQKKKSRTSSQAPKSTKKKNSSLSSKTTKKKSRTSSQTPTSTKKKNSSLSSKTTKKKPSSSAKTPSLKTTKNSSVVFDARFFFTTGDLKPIVLLSIYVAARFPYRTVYLQTDINHKAIPYRFITDMLGPITEDREDCKRYSNLIIQDKMSIHDKISSPFLVFKCELHEEEFDRYVYLDFGDNVGRIRCVSPLLKYDKPSYEYMKTDDFDDENKLYRSPFKVKLDSILLPFGHEWSEDVQQLGQLRRFYSKCKGRNRRVVCIFVSLDCRIQIIHDGDFTATGSQYSFIFVGNEKLSTSVPSGPNVFKVTGYLEYEDILPYCDFVVHSGGAGSTVAAMYAGKPQLIVGVDPNQLCSGNDKNQNKKDVSDLKVGPSVYRNWDSFVRSLDNEFAVFSANAAKYQKDPQDAVSSVLSFIEVSLQVADRDYRRAPAFLQSESFHDTWSVKSDILGAFEHWLTT